MTRDDLVKRLSSLLGEHDQYARCEAIKAVVAFERPQSGGTATDQFIRLLIQHYSAAN